jgi:predicted 2-oxoglutarate/Fe(II)-dependent dioxygenase YbiX
VDDSLVVPDFIDEETRARIVAELDAAPAVAAPVYGGATPGAAVEPRVRSTQQVRVGDALRESIRERLEAIRPRLETHFGVILATVEEPQFLRYGVGDFFVAHQDGNTPSIRDDSQHRRISVSVFLNPGAYGGGEFVFHGRYPDWEARHRVPALAGALVAFRSETTHEVTPVTHGVRYSIVTWYRAGVQP